MFQAGDNQFTIVNAADLENVEASESSITVQPLPVEREEVEEDQIQPPIPKVRTVRTHVS